MTNAKINHLSFPLQIKALEEGGQFTGYASVFGVVDRDRDRVLPGAFARSLKEKEAVSHIKFLWQHRAEEPIGTLSALREDNHGLYVEGNILLGVRRGQEAYELLKSGAVQGLSIGYRAVSYDMEADTGTRLLTDIDLWEISLVTFPSNPLAGVRTIKSVTADQRLMTNDTTLTKENLPMTTTITENDRMLADRVGSIEAMLSRPGKSAEGAYSIPDELQVAHKEAFCAYLRKGADGDLYKIEKKALSVGSDPDGGYLVTSQVAQSVLKTVIETTPMRRVASIIEISSDSLEILEDRDEAASGWTAETGAVSDTDTPELGKNIIPVHELYAQPKATQKLIDDSSLDIEQWLAEKLADTFSRKENAAFISGDGVGKPRGILTYAAGTGWGQIEQVVSGDDADVTADSLIKLYYSLKEEYATRATFLMSRATAQQARLLKEPSTGQYLWQPGLSAGAPDTLLGLPVIQAADMPAPASGSLSVALGDFSRAYQIVDRTGIRVLRDPYTDKPFVKFYSTKRTGGDVVNFEAIKLLKLSAS